MTKAYVLTYHCIRRYWVFPKRGEIGPDQGIEEPVDNLGEQQFCVTRLEYREQRGGIKNCRFRHKKNSPCKLPQAIGVSVEVSRRNPCHIVRARFTIRRNPCYGSLFILEKNLDYQGVRLYKVEELPHADHMHIAGSVGLMKLVHASRREPGA